MAIHFDKQRWQEIDKTYSLWWEQKLDRPLFKASRENRYSPDRECPKAPILDQSNCHDFSYSADEIVDRMDYELSKVEFLGDAFPMINFASFGPGVLAAFCGAKLDNSSGRVWFYPPDGVADIENLHIKYDPHNKWVNRIKDIYRAGIKKWQGNVLLGMPDLGGVMDVIATFCTSEELLFHLYDYPDEVSRLVQEVSLAWHEAYNDLASVLQPVNPGYSDWSGLYSSTPSYINQCDFSYMIGPDMYEKFVLPSLVNDCELLDNVIYHLDGIGELPHLDLLLSIEKLKAVQWVYGDGKPSARHWKDVYDKIAQAGKNIQLVGDLDDFLELSKLYPNTYYGHGINEENEKTILKILSK